MYIFLHKHLLLDITKKERVDSVMFQSDPEGGFKQPIFSTSVSSLSLFCLHCRVAVGFGHPYSNPFDMAYVFAPRLIFC